MASLTQWAWVSVNSGSLWWTARPGVLRFMGSQRVGHDWVTELNWTDMLESVSRFNTMLCPIYLSLNTYSRLPWCSVGKESACNAGDTGGMGSVPELGRSLGGGKWQPIPVFLPEKFHGGRSLASYRAKPHKESDTTVWLSAVSVLHDDVCAVPCSGVS